MVRHRQLPLRRNVFKRAIYFVALRAVVLNYLFLFLVPLSHLDAQIADRKIFKPNILLGDGQRGAIYNQWRQVIGDRPIAEISVTVRKKTGGSDTFVNMRFGTGAAFENGKRIYLKDNSSQQISWNLNRGTSEGMPLVCNAYNGEVYLESVEVVFADVDTSSLPSPREPGIGSVPRSQPYNTPRSYEGGRQDGDRYGGASQSSIEKRCRYERVRQPRIEIGRIRATGGLFSGKYKVEGSIYGACIQEAGYFEYGRLRQKIAFPVDYRFQRREFEVQVRGGVGGEIRVYTFDGGEDAIPVDNLIRSQQKPLF